MAFEFDIHAKGRPTDEEILKGIRRFVRLHTDGPATLEKFLRWPDRPCGEHLIFQRFGTWRNAVRKCGAVPPHLKELDVADLIRNLERVWRKVGYPPGQSMLRLHGRYWSGSYICRWGSVRNACRLLAKVRQGKMTLEEMIEMGKTSRKRRKRRAIRLGVRWQVLERDGFACQACGIRPANTRRGDGLHVDHVVPVSRGGTNDPSNLRTLCAACNIGRGAGRKKLPPSRPAPGAGSDT